MKIEQKEWQVVDGYLASMKHPLIDVFVTRRSDRKFDLTVEGKTVDNIPCMIWLVLGCIATKLDWKSPEVANMTDYPEDVLQGDWDGVLDTSKDKLWVIFHHFKLGDK